MRDGAAQILFESGDHQVLKEFYYGISFKPGKQKLTHCMCYGYPVIEWYNGNKRLAHIAVQHGYYLRSSEFRMGYQWPGSSTIADAPLTSVSAGWLIGRLVDMGIEAKYFDRSQRLHVESEE